VTDETHIRALIREAVDDLRKSDRLGPGLEKAIRTGHLPRDVDNLWWLRRHGAGRIRRGNRDQRSGPATVQR
jgi:hypothetical protein